MNCKQLYDFLGQLSTKNITTTVSPSDLAVLNSMGIVQTLTKDQFSALSNEVQQIGQMQIDLQKTEDERYAGESNLTAEIRKTHSILFHFENAEKKQQDLQKEQALEAEMKTVDTDLAAKQAAIADLISKKSLLDTLTDYGDGYIALTSSGMAQLRTLGVRLYRVSDMPIASYLEQSTNVDKELNDIALRSRAYVQTISGPLSGVDRTYEWAISIGLAKQRGDADQLVNSFLTAYAATRKLTSNVENGLMAAEVLSSMNVDVTTIIPTLEQIEQTVKKMDVPSESSLGVSSILLFGHRADGTYPTNNLAAFLNITKSYESAALLSILNKPIEELQGKFLALRQLFQTWGCELSEDVELASAYLTLSDLPAEGIAPKLSIIVKGMSAYLQYPLVASSILASIPVMEANETLSLLEEAYMILGRVAAPIAQPELISLAVRMIHGVQNEIVKDIDATGVMAQYPVGFRYPVGGFYYGVPLIIVHGSYYSTYSGIGGYHPGHVHMAGGFVG
jgi:hypothetical protein